MTGLRALLARRRRRDDMVCRDVVELVTDYLDGALSPVAQSRFERHLQACHHCVAYVDQVKTTAAVLGRVEAPAPDDQTRQALIEAFRDFSRD